MSNPSCPFNNEDLQQRGSRWLLANFHTHTPGSSDWCGAQEPGKKYTHEQIARGLLDNCLDKKIHVLGITDHNSPSFIRSANEEGTKLACPELGSYYALMRQMVDEDKARKKRADEKRKNEIPVPREEEPLGYYKILVLPGVEIGAENIHVLGLFPPSANPAWDVMKIASLLEAGGCPYDLFGDAANSCTDFSVSDAIDAIDVMDGIAIPAHIDQDSGFLKEEDQQRLLKFIVSRPQLFALEYDTQITRVRLEKIIRSTDVMDLYASRGGRSIAWTQSSDSHFVSHFDGAEDGNGVPLGREKRRTWLRIDPDNLSFDAVRAALLDPENRVRVDRIQKSKAMERQGSYRAPDPKRTYVRSFKLEWENGEAEKIRFNQGINALVGPSDAGKSSRAKAFSVLAGKRPDLAVDAPRPKKNAEDKPAPTLVRADLLLSRGHGGSEETFWWLHRQGANPGRIFISQVEPHGDGFRTRSGCQKWRAELGGGPDFNSKALRELLESLPDAEKGLAPSVPRAFDLGEMKTLLATPARLARFISWHYATAKDRDELHQLQSALEALERDPPQLTAEELAAKLNTLFKKLKAPRGRALRALKKFLGDNLVNLDLEWTTGTWRQKKEREKAAAKMLNPAPKKSPKDYLLELEDQATARLIIFKEELINGKKKRTKDKKRLGGMKAGSDINTALRGMLLVLGAGDIGPVVLDAPGTYFEPSDLVQTLAPLLLRARDNGAQVVVAIDDTNLPFAVDADLLVVCNRCEEEGKIKAFNSDATGSLEAGLTAAWALENLDGGGDQFGRRRQFYRQALRDSMAATQKRLAAFFLAPFPD